MRGGLVACAPQALAAPAGPRAWLSAVSANGRRAMAARGAPLTKDGRATAIATPAPSVCCRWKMVTYAALPVCLGELLCLCPAVNAGWARCGSGAGICLLPPLAAAVGARRRPQGLRV